MGGAKRKGVPGASTNENEAENDTRGPETPPVFDDLPRWRVTSGPVFRMVRLAAQVMWSPCLCVNLGLDVSHSFGGHWNWIPCIGDLLRRKEPCPILAA